MATKLQKMKWDLHQKKHRLLLLWGLINGFIAPYDDELIEKLRKVYYGGIPASVILLSNGMTNGHCYDRALLMSRAFLGDEGDVKLLYASIDNYKNHKKPGYPFSRVPGLFAVAVTNFALRQGNTRVRVTIRYAKNVK